MLHCHCDAVFEKQNFHWNRLVVSYHIFCINEKEFSGFGIYLIDIVFEFFVLNISFKYPFKDCILL